MIKGLAIGRNVHYVYKPGDIRAAIITGIRDEEKGTVNLRVLLDVPLDVEYSKTNIGYRTADLDENFVPFDSTGTKQRTWRFPEKS